MRSTTCVTAIIGACLALSASATYAEEPPPIAQLPRDLAHLAVAWVSIPQTMYTRTRADGPVLGLTAGTVEGSGLMVEDTVDYLTSGYADPYGPQEKRRPMGALLHYSF